jgi:hypothetical protein
MILILPSTARGTRLAERDNRVAQLEGRSTRLYRRRPSRDHPSTPWSMAVLRELHEGPYYHGDRWRRRRNALPSCSITWSIRRIWDSTDYGIASFLGQGCSVSVVGKSTRARFTRPLAVRPGAVCSGLSIFYSLIASLMADFYRPPARCRPVPPCWRECGSHANATVYA